MSAATPVWIVFGVTIGVAHAVWLWRAARHGRESPRAGIARLPLVVAVLVAGAVSGHVVAAAAGWMSGFAATTAGLARRRTP